MVTKPGTASWGGATINRKQPTPKTPMASRSVLRRNVIAAASPNDTL